MKRVVFIVGAIVLLGISAFSLHNSEKKMLEQQKVIIGLVYEQSPEVCEQVMFQVFQDDNFEEKIEAGEEALLQMGYTSQGVELLNQKDIFKKPQAYTLLVQVIWVCIVICILWIIMKKEERDEEKLVADISKHVENMEEFSALRYSGRMRAVAIEIQKLLHVLQAKEKERAQARENAQAFVENIAHQIKTPLTCISLSLDSLEETLQNQEQKAEMKQAFHYLKQIETLLKLLLGIGRMESGKVQLKKEAIHMENLIKDCINSLDADEKYFHLKIQREMTKEKAYFGDYEWLREAFLNILKNCMEHSGNVEKVDVRLTEKKECIHIQIRDYGTGISQEDIAFIFDRFYLPKNAKKTHTGIGLNLAELVIKKHFGVLKASNHEEGGAVFSILLPTYGMKQEKFQIVTNL